MKKIIALSLVCITVVLLTTGCKTTQTVTNWPDGTSTTNSVSTIDPQRTANAIQAIIPTAVRIAVAKEPKSREYLAKAQIAVCLLASSGNLSPEQLKQAVALTGINEIQTSEVQVAIEATYGIYQAYWGDVVANKLDQNKWLRPVLSAICDGIGNGLATTHVAEVPAQ